jgi:hypothetical protein
MPSDITGYRIYFSEYEGGPFVPKADNLSTTTTTITELAANRDYYFKITAKNTVGESRENETLLTATTPRITQIAYSETYRSSDYYPFVAVDGDGNVHVIYRRDDNKLYYTTNASGTWTTGSVEIDGVQIGMPQDRRRRKTPCGLQGQEQRIP